ncbi:hypothetical protein LA10_03653 [Thermotoga neapolitana LA10]|uniref:Hypothetical Membrane Spanning Protein n=1 Tax=Thermotoga neapolitana (strain ATCC 49049 / DSM 4359 / NBRC 107923 / NS-E) TaxID=309803 RepID=B9K7F9_THENN|nr:Hypothetical Membrane Spanning Protein [Thermotoga neapolitana DSM 4359]KFZ22004.1 hypothetical protein LA10_03653 [Thermotoga neapolitana LA10]
MKSFYLPKRNMNLYLVMKAGVGISGFYLPKRNMNSIQFYLFEGVGAVFIFLRGI